MSGTLGNFMRDQFQQAIDGLLVFEARRRVAKTGASDAEGAFITARLAFYKYPDLMAQFAPARTLEVACRLKEGHLETTTTIQNVGRATMPNMIARPHTAEARR